MALQSAIPFQSEYCLYKVYEKELSQFECIIYMRKIYKIKIILIKQKQKVTIKLTRSNNLN